MTRVDFDSFAGQSLSIACDYHSMRSGSTISIPPSTLSCVPRSYLYSISALFPATHIPTTTTTIFLSVFIKES